MSLLIRIPALLVALGLLASGGQAKVCEIVAFVGIDLHAPAEGCSHSHEEHSHSESEPCSEDCLVELSEGVAPAPDSVPSVLATEGFDSFHVASSDSLSDVVFYNRISDFRHGPLLDLPSLDRTDPLFSGRIQV